MKKNGKRQKIGARRKMARAQSRAAKTETETRKPAQPVTGMASQGSAVAAYNGPVRSVLDNTVPGGVRWEPAL